MPPLHRSVSDSFSPVVFGRFSGAFAQPLGRHMSDSGTIQWANSVAYPIEPSDLELGSPSQVPWSEKIKHQILLLRLQRCHSGGTKSELFECDISGAGGASVRFSGRPRNSNLLNSKLVVMGKSWKLTAKLKSHMSLVVSFGDP